MPRGVGFLPGSSAILRGWQRVRARPKACHVGWVFFLAAVPSCVGARRGRARPAWGNLLRRDSPRPLSDLFAPPKHPFWRNFFGDGSPLPRLGTAFGKWASLGPSPVVGRKPNNPLGAPGTGMTSPGGSRFPYRWFAPGLAAGVSRGENYLPRTHAPLRGWERAHARPQACRVGKVFFIVPAHPCAGGSGPMPAASGRGPLPAPLVLYHYGRGGGNRSGGRGPVIK